MAGRALSITSRILFFVCGLGALLDGAPYVILRGAELPVQSEWIIFVVALGLVGLFSLVVAVLPRSWLARVCRTNRDEGRLFSTPLKVLGVLAVIFYGLAVVAYFSPHSWNLNTQVMLALCPMYFIKQAIDPPAQQIFLILGPMNAAVYGAVGVLLGYAGLAFRGGRR